GVLGSVGGFSQGVRIPHRGPPASLAIFLRVDKFSDLDSRDITATCGTDGPIMHSAAHGAPVRRPRPERTLAADSETMKCMPTDEKTIAALGRIAEALENLGVKGEDLKALKRHIGQQKRQLAWLPDGSYSPRRKGKPS